MRNNIGYALASIILKAFCTKDYLDYMKLVVAYGEAEVEQQVKRTK